MNKTHATHKMTANNNYSVTTKEPNHLAYYRIGMEPDFELMSAYVAGICDSSGMISISAIPSSASKHGYRIVTRFSLTRRSSDLIMLLDEWAQHHGVFPNISEIEKRGTTYYKFMVERRSEFKTLVEAIAPYLLVKHNDVQVILNEILPRLDDKQHTSKEGFVELMEYVDSVRHDSQNKNIKYDRQYFIDLWELDARSV